jgi:hypothetical protein
LPLFGDGEIILKYLLYCIFRSRQHQKVADIIGVDDQPVILVKNNGISAAVSRTVNSDLLPDISRILAYKNVIESFHQDQTLIPMRYGCLLEAEKQVVQLLKENQIQYETLLKELDNCVEMGIRVLIEDSAVETCAAPAKPASRLKTENLPNSDNTQVFNPYANISGRQYIIERSAYYAQKDKLSNYMETLVNHYKKVFSGLYTRFRFDFNPNSKFGAKHPYRAIPNSTRSKKQRQILALYYLVPRQSVDRFRRMFRRFCATNDVKLLLSGPWPPFNFVVSERLPDCAAQIAC